MSIRSVRARRRSVKVPPTRQVLTGLGLVCILFGTTATAHDLFFRASTYFLPPRSEAVIDVLSGTFSKSENAITRDRLADVSLVTPEGRVALEHDRWSERDPRSTVRVTTGAAGTYVLGAAIRPLILSLPGPEFNAYLKEEGLEAVLALRKEQKRLGEPSRERYSKYLKALLQVGDTPSDAHGTALGYAAEIVPEQNPFRLQAGDRLTVRCIVDGRPWAGKVVFAGGRRAGGDRRLPRQRLITDADGRATVHLTAAGTWYVKFVAMVEVADEAANYESKWSTLSFAVGAVR
jgi:uncharacterized GH25 family protein